MDQGSDAVKSLVGNAGYAFSRGRLPPRTPYHPQLILEGAWYDPPAYSANRIDIVAARPYSKIKASKKYEKGHGGYSTGALSENAGQFGT